MGQSIRSAFGQNFLGDSPRWYKQTIIAFLVINPLLWFLLPDAKFSTLR